jgi:hypothetical protein
MAESGYAALARRLAQWTTKGLLIALIFAAGLGFGREALRWWTARSPGNLTGPLVPAEGLGDPSRCQELLFGDCPWQIDTEAFSGDRARVTASLVERCRQSAAGSPLPVEAAGPGEVQFLHYLRGQSPVGSPSGSCPVYRLEGVFPMAVGVRASAGVAAGANRTPAVNPGGHAGIEQGSQSQQPVVESGFRVVTWGMAVPRGTASVDQRTSPVEQWTLYVFHAAGPARAAADGLPEVALPAGSRRLVSMRVAGGGSMATFQGAARASGWQRFFDDWFSSHGWTAGEGWTSAGPVRHCRYRPAAGHGSASAEVEIADDGRGGLTGLLMLEGTNR